MRFHDGRTRRSFVFSRLHLRTRSPKGALLSSTHTQSVPTSGCSYHTAGRSGVLFSLLIAGGIQRGARQATTRSQPWKVLAPKLVQCRFVERCQLHGLYELGVLEYLEFRLVMEYPLVLDVAVQIGTTARAAHRLAWQLLAHETLHFRKRIQRSPVAADHLAGVGVSGQANDRGGSDGAEHEDRPHISSNDTVCVRVTCTKY